MPYIVIKKMNGKELHYTSKELVCKKCGIRKYNYELFENDLNMCLNCITDLVMRDRLNK